MKFALKLSTICCVLARIRDLYSMGFEKQWNKIIFSNLASKIRDQLNFMSKTEQKKTQPRLRLRRL